MADAERDELWRRYKEEHDAQARDSLIVAYAPLVRYVAGRLAMGLPAHLSLDDLESYGLLGLIDAVGRFDPARGVRFETYALRRVRGAIIDGLRAETWAPALRQRARRLEQAYAALETTLGRSPTAAELAAYLGISQADLQRYEAGLGAVTVLSLDESWGEDKDAEPAAERLADQAAVDPAGAVLRLERDGVLAAAIERLPDKERLVVTLFYYEGLTAKEISLVMGLSQARISQLHAKAILRLRGRLGRIKQQILS